MKNYNKILEAVNRGIQFALDDYEDNELNGSLSQQNDIIDSEDIIKQKYDLMKDVVDLGLPSGTLWCKANLGADCGNTPESWYGDYYAWGETEPKLEFDWYNYKYANEIAQSNKEFDWYNYKYANEIAQSNKILVKYCTKQKYCYLHNTDNLIQLLPEDDAAYQNKHIGNYKFHIPTREQFIELLHYTTQTWETNYNSIEGLNGMKFTGTNGNTLFIPAAGNCTVSKLYSVSNAIFAWTSSLDCECPLSAWICSLFYYDKGQKDLYTYNRCFGLSIRPIIKL